MSKSHWSNTRQRLGNRAGIVIAGTIGFAIGGVTLAGALGADDTPVTTPTEVSVSAPDSSVVDSTIVDSTIVDTSIVDTSLADSTIVDSTVVDDSLPDSSLPDSSDPDSSTPGSLPDSSVPDSSNPSSSTPDSSVPSNPLPAPFTKTYDSAGGSITVTWSGTAFTLDSVNAAAGFDVEIKDQRWDRIRVEFDNGDDDSRIEVRISDDDTSVRVRID
ncbi:MAG: hypothetical protein ABMA25_04860 [Ilumatobacteraceae bacterium]